MQLAHFFNILCADVGDKLLALRIEMRVGDRTSAGAWWVGCRAETRGLLGLVYEAAFDPVLGSGLLHLLELLLLLHLLRGLGFVGPDGVGAANLRGCEDGWQEEQGEEGDGDGDGNGVLHNQGDVVG